MTLRVDLSIWRGNNAPALIWTLPDAVPIADSAFFLTVAAAGTLLLAKDTTGGTLALDAATRQLRLAFTTEESRLIPPGQIAEYEIERRTAGLEITEFYGFLAGLGGLNADEGASSGVQLDFSNPDNSNQQLLGWI